MCIRDRIDSILSASVLMAEQKGVTVRMDKMDPVYVWADEFDIEEVFTLSLIHI